MCNCSSPRDKDSFCVNAHFKSDISHSPCHNPVFLLILSDINQQKYMWCGRHKMDYRLLLYLYGSQLNYNFILVQIPCLLNFFCATKLKLQICFVGNTFYVLDYYTLQYIVWMNEQSTTFTYRNRNRRSRVRNTMYTLAADGLTRI